ncbi:hypothetical protein ACPV5R_04740 [Vibrio astriarenae]
MQHSLSKQSGHAAILFAMMIPAFFGLFTLGSDGARMMQSKARLGDAMEAASLAVTAHASTDNSANGINQTIAKNYIEYYASDLKEVNNVSVARRDCDTATECVPGEDMKFFQYDVTASVKFDSWFPGNEAIVGFGENFNVGAAGRARKYQSHAIDVVLAADFSGSMREHWDNNSSNPIKYIELMDIIALVADELENFNQLVSNGVNTIGLAPYDHNNRVKLGIDPDKGTNTGVTVPFDYSICSNATRSLRVPKEGGSYDADGIVLGRIDHLVETTLTTPTQSQYQKMIDNMQNDLYAPSYCRPDDTELARFYSVDLTSDFSAFKNEVKDFRPDEKSGKGFTASFQGFIEGTRLLKKGENERKLLILLSDGEDNGGNCSTVGGNGPGCPSGRMNFKTIATALYRDHGMCDSIKSYLEDLGDDKPQAHVELAVIGFDYPVGSYAALENCVGTDNVYQAENKEEILAQILSLIAEEIGRLK